MKKVRVNKAPAWFIWTILAVGLRIYLLEPFNYRSSTPNYSEPEFKVFSPYVWG